MKKICLLGVLLFLPSMAFADSPPNYSIDPSWLSCQKVGDCALLEDSFCHYAHVVNAAHSKAWNTLDKKTSRQLKTKAPIDLCGKPGQSFSTVKEAIPACENNICVFHDLKKRSNGLN